VALSSPRPELLSIPPHDRGRRLEPDADATTLVDIGTLGGNAPDDIRRLKSLPSAATLTRSFPSHAIIAAKRFPTTSVEFSLRDTRA
jgi:hypothetical protein